MKNNVFFVFGLPDPQGFSLWGVAYMNKETNQKINITDEPGVSVPAPGENATGVDVEKLSEEEIAELVKDVLANQEKYQGEAKYILLLNLESRHEGCGYVYNYFSEYAVFMGDAQIVNLDVEENHDCVTRERVAIIPQSVPVILLQHDHDDSPEKRDTLTIHVFDGKEWKALAINVPKYFRLDP